MHRRIYPHDVILKTLNNLLDQQDQRSILHQLYDLAIMTTRSWEELERTWEALAHEEEIAIGSETKKTTIKF
jgi:hypothetical protein